MAARKLQQEVDKTFKKVDEGCAEFDAINEKLASSNNAAQKDKLEETLKREIKKLQRLRDQIKSWYASSEIKDKEPLMEKRKLIESKMEAFKLVEKAMKTKQFSKEGLSAAAKLDPKERARAEACDFLNTMVDDLERQIETMEAEHDSLQATMKKGKIQAAKADRIAEIERITERHKWHQGKLELMKRALENDSIETDQVTGLEDDIRYYVSDGMNGDFNEDEELYDELNLVEEEEAFGMNNDNDKGSSQDTQSIQDDAPEPESRSTSIPGGKSRPQDTSTSSARRPSQQLKSPLPALATLHSAPLSNLATNVPPPNMKPAAVPTRAPGETLKYASAAAAAANNLGIAPLPPPPGATPPSTSSIPAVPVSAPSPPAVPSPLPAAAQPISQQPSASRVAPQPAVIKDVQASSTQKQSPALSHSSTAPSAAQSNSIPPTPAAEAARLALSASVSGKQTPIPNTPESRVGLPAPKGATNGSREISGDDEDESVYHLPSGFQDLVQSFEVTQSRASLFPSPSAYRMMDASWDSRPSATDSDAPKIYKPKYRFQTPDYYPQAALPIFENPSLYSRIDPDTLFYIFYYKQNTYQQYLAAKALKEQSWRFHKQYQTWFQRHEEPKTITDEFEQGTYRFFDYESTWSDIFFPSTFFHNALQNSTLIERQRGWAQPSAEDDMTFIRWHRRWGRQLSVNIPILPLTFRRSGATTHV